MIIFLFFLSALSTSFTLELSARCTLGISADGMKPVKSFQIPFGSPWGHLMFTFASFFPNIPLKLGVLFFFFFFSPSMLMSAEGASTSKSPSFFPNRFLKDRPPLVFIFGVFTLPLTRADRSVLSLLERDRSRDRRLRLASGPSMLISMEGVFTFFLPSTWNMPRSRLNVPPLEVDSVRPSTLSVLLARERPRRPKKSRIRSPIVRRGWRIRSRDVSLFERALKLMSGMCTDGHLPFNGRYVRCHVVSGRVTSVMPTSSKSTSSTSLIASKVCVQTCLILPFGTVTSSTTAPDGSLGISDDETSVRILTCRFLRSGGSSKTSTSEFSRNCTAGS
ncbi:uncharacterized protein LOC119104445 isoform X2 [Pollicipes pollicipes]|uniref:uncharacterized protein LOC119104445 isoform X1 n=1 Tax=Pollicipes pollicipes TaxID=41117 RepID=UPI001884FAB7|nr:uncharacterized protein LOC119104445 isoform X1 [Pollicipes pollicipes]XP_037084038.1 uncharacterized protein LOC119104445 isoform X2 [Pollicipes pollicipes]